jgi:hypothetical protein
MNLEFALHFLDQRVIQIRQGRFICSMFPIPTFDSIGMGGFILIVCINITYSLSLRTDGIPPNKYMSPRNSICSSSSSSWYSYPARSHCLSMSPELTMSCASSLVSVIVPNDACEALIQYIGEVENGLLCENVSGAREAVSGQWKSDCIKR